MDQKKIYILMGNPDTDTLSGEIATRYEQVSVAAGHEVRRSNISDLSFDPILHLGYKVIQPLEQDLLLVQENMKWADHFVLIYPLWWSSMPALLKGMWDRMFIPGFAFKFYKDRIGWEKLLKGKTARVIVLSKTKPWQIRLLFGDPYNEIKHAILGFAGYRVSLTTIGNSEGLSTADKDSLMLRIGKLAKVAN